MLMPMLRCLFFVEAQCQCTIVASHIPGQHNDLADDLSRNRANIFLSIKTDACQLVPINIHVSLLHQAGRHHSPTDPEASEASKIVWAAKDNHHAMSALNSALR